MQGVSRRPLCDPETVSLATVGGKMVRLVTHGEDKYDTTIADIYLPGDDPLGVVEDLFPNRELVRRGLAWHYKECSDDKRLADDEDNARLKKLGLWGGSHKPIAPWDWRKMSKDERDELRWRLNLPRGGAVEGGSAVDDWRCHQVIDAGWQCRVHAASIRYAVGAG